MLMTGSQQVPPTSITMLSLVLVLAGTTSVVASGSARRPLYIGGYMPFKFITSAVPHASVIGPPVRLAVDLINNSTDLLPDYELLLQLHDTRYSVSSSMKKFFHMVNANTTTIFMLGPVTSSVASHVCAAAPGWNIVQVSFFSRSSTMDDRRMYPYFFRTLQGDASLNPLRLQILREFEWKKIAIVFQEISGNLFAAAISDFENNLKADEIEILAVQAINRSNYEATFAKLQEVDARIIFCNFFSSTSREFFCEAYRRGFYGSKYVWILPGYVNNEWWKTRSRNPAYNCTPEQLTEATDGHFSIDYLTAGEDTPVLGMTVKDFRAYVTQEAGSIHSTASYAFDAMLAIGHVLHTASRDRGLNLSEFSYDNSTFSTIFAEELLKLDFTGISGPVGFNALGNRIGKSIVEQCQGGVRKVVGSFSRRTNIFKMGPHPVIWPGNGRKPRDGARRMRKTLYLPLTATALICVLSALGFTATCAFVAFNFKFSHLQYIKLSSPKMNNIVAIGCGLGYISVILYSIDGRQLDVVAFGSMCHARLFTLSVAYSLAFGALFLKTWRVHRIMANKKLEKIKLKDRHLLAWILLLVAVDLLFLCVWISVDPWHRDLASLPLQVDQLDADLVLEPYVEKCHCQQREYWFGAMMVYKGSLLLFGLFLAWETRKINVSALNDSKYIGMSVYNLAIIGVVGVSVGFIISDKYYISNYVISSLFIFLAVTTTLCLVFVPKLHAVYLNPSGEVDMRVGTTYTSRAPRNEDDIATLSVMGTVTGTSRVAPMGQAAMSIALQRRLEKMVAERDSQITQLKLELFSKNSESAAPGTESTG